MMKNLMSSRGCGALPLCCGPAERWATLSHSLVLRNTRTSRGSKGTSELHSSSLGDGGGGGGREGLREGEKGEEGRGGSSREPKGVAIRAAFTHYINMSKWFKVHLALGNRKQWELCGFV